MNEDIVNEMLPCVLTAPEMAQLAIDLGQLQTNLEQLKVTRKDLVSAITYKSKVAVDGSEIRKVECRWEMDYVADRKRLIRQDTFNEVRSVAMTAEDRQRRLTNL